MSGRADEHALQLAEALEAERTEARERERKRSDLMAQELAGIRSELAKLREYSSVSIRLRRFSFALYSALERPLPALEPPEAAVRADRPPTESDSRTSPRSSRQENLDAMATASKETPMPAASPPIDAPLIDPNLKLPQPDSESGLQQRLTDRAVALMNARDISGARLVLERAVTEGSARAAHLLAQTYDPKMLRTWAVLGVRGDQTKAEEVYSKARAGGSAHDKAQPHVEAKP